MIEVLWSRLKLQHIPLWSYLCKGITLKQTSSGCSDVAAAFAFFSFGFFPSCAWGAFGAEAWAGCEVDATGVAIVLKKGRVIAGGR